VILLLSAALAADPYVLVLGTAQDGGHPQAACQKSCCQRAWEDPSRGHLVSSLAVVDPDTGERWLLDATPSLPAQWHRLDEAAGPGPLTGVLLTHAHIGHYTGLMHLGREVTGSKGVSTYVMPRMAAFLREHGPWSQLVALGNIELVPVKAGDPVVLSPRLTATPVLVPHRDEFSETVGWTITGPTRSVLYLPDIDKWERWERPIEDVVRGVDRAYLDATFFDTDELPGRDMSEIPHPFIVETIARFAPLPVKQRAKVHFIHLNHSNPALDPAGEAAARIDRAGHAVAQEGERFSL
jgi:pyrroloquinoline quinone biosynthesis protein B